MNTYSVKKFDEAVDLIFGESEHTWDNFLCALRKGPVYLPTNVVAELAAERGGLDGEAWFTTVVKGWGGPWWFKRTTHSNSFGSTINGDTFQVQPVKVERTDWEEV
jgi:hypothetical protein